MKICLIGVDWIAQYLMGDVLLKDQDAEDEIIVYDQRMTISDIFHFPPLAKYAGDERVTVLDKWSPIIFAGCDVIIFNSNFLQESQNLFASLTEHSYTGRVLVISSWEVYGFQGRRQIPFDEFETGLSPSTPLGQTKFLIEEMARQHKDLNVVIFRLSTIFGPYMPENDELIKWLEALLTQRSILVEQPAARAYDLCYMTNVLAPIQKAFTADLPKHCTINLGSADVDYKTVREKGKDVIKPQIFEKNVVNALLGLRHMLDSHSKIEISNEGIEAFQGKGFHSQLKTATARKLLDYYPVVDTMKGFLQTAFWLQKSMELDQASQGRAIEDIYPTLDEREVYKVGEGVHDTEIEYEKRKKLEEASKEARTDVDKVLVCALCDHVPMMLNPSKTNPDNLDEECTCQCHLAYKEIES